MLKDNASNRPYDVLVVEDNDDDVELLLAAMRKVQAEMEIEIKAHTIANGRQASLRLKEHRFDAIFLDLQLPPPDGMELTREIRGSEMNRTTPIVILTGGQDRNLMARAFEAGANMFLFKPIDRRQLLRLMQVTRAPIDRERRRLQRVKVKCKVSIESGKDRLEGETLDLSLNGMFVQAGRVLPIGSIITVNFILPRGIEPLRTSGRVARIVGSEFMGVQLENIGKSESEQMGDFLLPLIVSATNATAVKN